MPQPATGGARIKNGRWQARVTVRRKRIAIPLTTCRPEQEEKAQERAALLANLAKRLGAGGGELDADLAERLLRRAGACDRPALDAIVTAIERLAAGEAAPPISAVTTVRSFGEQWTSGKLHRRWPDHVKAKDHATDISRLEAYVYPQIGNVALLEVTVSHADQVMAALPDRLSPASRRHVAQVLARLLKLAAYPARVIPRSPLPAGFLPPIGKRKALTFLYPDEDRALLRCEAVPLEYRMLYGFLAREGMRKSEAAGLAWSDVDRERGAVALDKNKTDDPRAWALDAGVVRALQAWHELQGRPGEIVPVFLDERGRSATSDDGCVLLREHLRAAGVTRAELFERSDVRIPIRIHDLRATFITIALANGRTETWVADRTGHTSSQMINRYRRAARRVAELNLGELAPLDEAIPELAALRPPPAPEPPPERAREIAAPARDGGRDGGPKSKLESSEPSRTVASVVENAPDCAGLVGDGSWRTRTSSQWIKSSFSPARSVASSTEIRVFEGSLTTVGDGWAHIRAHSAHIKAPASRAELVHWLGRSIGEAAAAEAAMAVAGDLAAARLAHELGDRLRNALGDLLGAPTERADVVDLAQRRRS